MNFVDIIIILIFAASILVGLGRGFVRELISLLTLIAAFFIATTFANQLAEGISHLSSVQHAVEQSTSAIGASTAQPASYGIYAVAFTILFIGTLLLGAIFTYMLNMAFQTGIMGLGNHLLGGLFGFVRAFFISVIIVLVVQLTPMGSEPAFAQSRFVSILQPTVDWLNQFITPTINDLKDRVSQSLQDVTSTTQ